MPRELRSLKPRPNYAALFEYDGDNQAGPSGGPIPVEDDVESGSDFAPEVDNPQGGSVQADMEIGGGLGISGYEATEPQKTEPRAAKAKTPTSEHKSKAPPARARSSISLAPGLARSNNRHSYSLPQPHVHHRHRAIPLYRREANVERLKEPPALFSPSEATSTNSFTSSPKVTLRLGRACGANVGPGPLWQLLEDRGWYKEALIEGDEAKEEKRRPRVYQDVPLSNSSKVLSKEEASYYLPSDITVTDNNLPRPPLPVVCSFGPFGHQKQIQLKMFEAVKLSDMIQESHSNVFNAGAPVWGMDWCPTHPEDRPHLLHKQFLAVSTFPSSSYSPSIGVKVPRPFNSCVQIWSLSPTGEGDDRGEMKCELVLCIESGPAHALRWCPLPSTDFMGDPRSSNQVRKLGLLAGTFEDGSLSIYAVPYPPDLTASNDISSEPVFLKIPPILRIELEDTFCWSLDWGNSEVLAIGCTNGCIAVYDISQALRNGAGLQHSQSFSIFCLSSVERLTGLLPLHYISVHQSAIRSLTWIRVPPASSSGALSTNDNPTVIASGGYDGVEGFTDLREPSTNVFNRTRDVINDITYSPYGAGVATIDHENIVKMYSASPSMLGRGHSLIESGGPVWSLGSSDYHPHLAVGSVDGTCMTTNALRSTRKGGIPLFSYKIYQLDYNRQKKEFRMLERFLPQETQDRPSATRAKSKNPNVQVNPVGTGAWSPEVGVHRVVWNSGNGLSNSHLLASSTGSGLCRIDWLVGRWLKGKVPYYDVGRMRGEVDDEMDIDDEEESE